MRISKIKSRHTKLKHGSRSRSTSRSKSKSVNKIKPIKINLDIEKAELLLLYITLVNYVLLMLRQGKTKSEIKKSMMTLLHQLRKRNHVFKDMTNKDLDKLFEKHYSVVLSIKQNIEKTILQYGDHKVISKMGSKTKKKYKSKGGFYFRDLEEKGDQPITGNDLSRFLDEMQQFFYNAQYTEEGQFLRDTNTVISMLRGDLAQFKGIVQYQILPKYYSIFPPFLRWDNIKTDFIDRRKWEDLPDYLLAYQSYLRSRDQYLVDKGLKSPNVLNKDLYTGFYDKLAHSIDTNIYKMQAYRRYAHGQVFPISLPT